MINHRSQALKKILRKTAQKSVFQLIWKMFTLGFIVEFRFKDLRFFQSFLCLLKTLTLKNQRCYILFTLTHLMQVKQLIFLTLFHYRFMD